MTRRRHSDRPAFTLTRLEPRTVPALTVLAHHSFDPVGDGALPADWASWVNNPRGRVGLETGPGDSGAIVTRGASNSVTRTWLNDPMPADVRVSGSFYLGTLIPVQLFTRGRDLDTDAPSYYGVSVVRGLEIELVRVENGVSTPLAKLNSARWFSAESIRISLATTGNTIDVQLNRLDTGEYLDANGQWVAEQAHALSVRDDALQGAGRVGLNRVARYAGPVAIDDWVVEATTPLSPILFSDPFDLNEPSTWPDGWTGWSSHGGPAFFATPDGYNGSIGLAAGIGSGHSARAWVDPDLPADVCITASVYVNSLIPAQIFARGSDLDTDTPSYYAVAVRRGIEVELIRVSEGEPTVLGERHSAGWQSYEWIQVSLRVEGDQLGVTVRRLDTDEYLTESGEWVEAPTETLTVRDASIERGGHVGLGLPAAHEGTVAFDDFTAVALGVPMVPPPTDAAPVEPPPVMAPPPSEPAPVQPGRPGLTPVPRHFSHVRIAQLAYYGTPIGELEQRLLRDAVDLVVPHPVYLSEINAISPGTPQFIYLNVSNIYEGLYTDWLRYADRNGVSREVAFFHVNRPTPFMGDSASSLAVRHFWAAYQNAGAQWIDRTTAARGINHRVEFPGGDGAVYFGYPEKFREFHVELTRGATDGWAGVVEYATAVDGQGRPVAWRAMPLLGDTSNGLRRNGSFTFDPPSDWRPASVNGSDPLYFLRVRTTSAGNGPVARTISGRDYVHARGTISGTIPAFDFAADRDGDGYLNDAEYAARRPGHDARFVYESRAFYPAYGQMRFATNPSGPAYRAWAADFTRRFLDANPLADGVFMDNSIGRLAFDPNGLHESLADYSTDYGNLLAQIDRAIAPRFILANTAGARNSADGILANQVSYLEEFGLRPLASNHIQFRDMAGLIARRRELSGGNAYEIFDSYPVNGSPTDPRTQIATLAMYYLIADPEVSFLMMNGGLEPNSTWSRHWSEAVRFDVGRPRGEWHEFAAGKDPEDGRLDFSVFGREYDNALVLYKPRSYSQGVNGQLGPNTATTHALNGRFRVLNADGSLGTTVTQVTLRNGDGAILVKAN